MKLTCAVAFLATAIVATAASSSAQERVVKASVPFNFTLGARALPSGTYTLTSSFNHPGIIHVSDRTGQHNALSLALPGGSSRAAGGMLVFHRYGSQYFLSEIRCADSSMNVHFIETKTEKRAKTEVERAGKFVDDPVLLALN